MIRRNVLQIPEGEEGGGGAAEGTESGTGGEPSAAEKWASFSVADLDKPAGEAEDGDETEGEQTAAEEGETTETATESTTTEEKPKDEDEDIGAVARAMRAIQTKESEVNEREAAIRTGEEELQRKTTEATTRFKDAISTQEQLNRLRSGGLDVKEALRFIWGPDVDLDAATANLSEADRQMGRADVERIATEKARKLYEEQEAARTAAERKRDEDARAARAAEIDQYKSAARGIMEQATKMLGEFPALKAIQGNRKMSYTTDFIASDGKEPLTLGDELLIVMNERHVAKQPFDLKAAITELAKRHGSEPGKDAAPNGTQKPAGGKKLTVPSATQSAGASGKRAPTTVEEQWAELEAFAKKLDAAS